MTWRADLPEGGEVLKCHDRIAGFVFGHGADLGCGCWKLKVEKTREASCLGIDGGFSPFACKEADLIADVANLTQFQDESFDYIFSSHTLEDMPYPEAVLMEWWRLVKVGGNLILYLPLTRRVAKEMGLENWEGFYPNIGEPGANVYHRQDFHPQEIRDIIAKIGDAETLADEIRGEGEEYSFLQVYKKLSNGPNSIWSNPMIQCLCEYHRRHYESNLEQGIEGMENEGAFQKIAKSNSGQESKAPNVGSQKSLVQNRPTVVQDSRTAAP